MPPVTDELPHLTADLPGTGGRIKVGPDDFVVHEIPLYVPSGKGHHLYLLVEKRGISTFEAVQRLSRALKRPQREFGFAGLKDAHALTRQYISVGSVSDDRVAALDLPGIRILETIRHKNKLKRGHLQGNRFRITIHGVSKDAVQKTRSVLAVLSEKGVPNFFGEQRFGLLGNTHLLGKALLAGDFERFADELIATPRTGIDPDYGEVISHYERGEFAQAATAMRRSFKYERRVLETLSRMDGDYEKAAMSLDKRIIDLYMSAYQSHLFNRLLARRICGIDRLEEGDIAWIHRNGACFLVEDLETESPRADAFEISPSGPLFGSKLLMPRGRPLELENEILMEEGLALDDFERFSRYSVKGARRPLRVPLNEVSVSEGEKDSLVLSFDLPPGCYATVVLREVMKSTKI